MAAGCRACHEDWGRCVGAIYNNRKRWEILKAMTSAGPLAIREIARRVARDVKAVHGDVHRLVNAGLLEKTNDGKIIFPYDEVHVDFVLKAA